MKDKIVVVNFSGNIIETIQAQLFFLKALNLIDLSWWWVLSPAIVWVVMKCIVSWIGTFFNEDIIEVEIDDDEKKDDEN